MALPHVTAGEVARAAEQNVLIDEVNEHTNTLDLNAGTIGEHTTRLDELEQAQPLCVLRKSANQIIRNQASTGASDPSMADQVVSWDIAEVDPLGMKSGNTIVVPQTQPYLIAGQLNLSPIPDGGVPGECILYITRNDGFVGDVSIAATGQAGKVGGGFGNGLSTVSVRKLNAGDVLRIWCYQSSSADRNARATSFGGCTFAVSTPQ